MSKYIASVIVFIYIISIFVVSIGADSIPVWKEDIQMIPTSVVDETIDMKLDSGGAILIEANSGKILYEYNPHEKLRPASVTKVMTILLIMESLDSGKMSLQDRVPCSEQARKMGGSQIWLNENEELTIDDMLKAICVVSANDCSVAMAEYIAGSEEAFVALMNKRATELGMNDTVFKNCHGIDEEGHVTSAYDIALMSRELIVNHPDVTKYTTIWMDSLRDGKSQLVNTNKLVRNYKGATGLKTGSTSIALYNLSATATRDDLSLVAVVMKAPTSDVRFAEAKRLLDYGFNNYQYKELSVENAVLNQVNVDKGITQTVDAVFEKDSGTLMQKGEDKNITQNVQMEDTVNAPVNKGQKIGEVIYSVDESEIARVNIVAGSEVKKVSVGNMLAHVYKNWFRLLR